jgi:hypothetical protein
MLSFHNDINVKKKYIDCIRDDIDEGRLFKCSGIEWYESKLGLPKWLAHVEEKINHCMSLTKKKNERWYQLFLESIPVGVPEERFTKDVLAPFLVAVLLYTLDSFDNHEHPYAAKNVKDCIDLYERCDIGSDDWCLSAKHGYNKSFNDCYGYDQSFGDRFCPTDYISRSDYARNGVCYMAYMAVFYAYASSAALLPHQFPMSSVDYAAKCALSLKDREHKYDYFADVIIGLLKKLGESKDDRSNI